MSLASMAERLTRRTWTDEIVDAYVGPFVSAHLAHAVAASVREDAASGGAVTAILVALLDADRVDGALVCVSAIEDGRVRARYRIATTRNELLAARGSTYVLGAFVAEALPLIEAFEGRLAVVGLPCELTALARHTGLAEKVAVRIALFCGHATTSELVDHTTARLTQRANGAKLTSFRFRIGHWRGMTRAGFDDGTVIEQPFSAYGLYQNLYYFAAKKCMFCGDHFGYDSDLSAGDIWSAKYKSDPIKHTALIVKTQAGADAIALAEQRGECEVVRVDIGEVLDGQRRIAPFHYNVSARAQAGVGLGLKIPDRVGAHVRWHERAAARIALQDFLATQSPEGAAAVLRTDRRVLKLKLLLLKGLESLS
ncbi:MAG: Coenzyme F420 hydrogenase/dehydrogenase, beta subunit C-terminal domain [Coriobacteriia bacterium]|nr:Coenzyme F420 hydrogenase/dehydrogenase, beta subunit C-terminal domain [Coriobacteriia bacterium]